MKCTFYHLTFPSIFRLYEISSVKSWTESRLSSCQINKYFKIQFASAISYSSLDYWHFEHFQMNRMIQICIFSFAASQNWYETFCFDVFYLQITTPIRKKISEDFFEIISNNSFKVNHLRPDLFKVVYYEYVHWIAYLATCSSFFA